MVELLAPLIVCRSVGEREENRRCLVKTGGQSHSSPEEKVHKRPLYVVTSIGKEQKRKRNSFKEKDDEKRIKKTNKNFYWLPKKGWLNHTEYRTTFIHPAPSTTTLDLVKGPPQYVTVTLT